MKCIECGKTIGILDEKCPYCGEMQYDEEPAKHSPSGQRVKKERPEIFSEEAILALGLYPKDEGYRMSLISRILDK